jgi:cytochrome P450
MSNTRTTAPMATEAAMREDFAAVSDLLGGGAPDDVHALYRSFRASQPVMEGDILARFGVPSQADYSNLGRKVYTLFKYHDVMAVLRDPESYSSSLLNEGLGQFLGGFLMTGMEGDRHRVIRNLLAPAFSPVAVARWKERLRPVVREAIDRLVPAGKADLVQDVLLPLPVRLIYAIMGYPPDERKMQEYAARAMKILVGPQRDPEKLRLSLEAAFKAARELYDDTLAVVRQRRAEGSAGDDLMGFLIRARYEDRTLSDEEITELMRQFLPAAAETTTRSFGSMLVALLQRPALPTGSAPIARSCRRSSSRGCAGKPRPSSWPGNARGRSRFAA